MKEFKNLKIIGVDHGYGNIKLPVLSQKTA